MTYEAEMDLWRKQRLAALTAEDGWLDLTDRLDLAPGRYTVGSAEDADLRLSVGPARLGMLELAADGAATLGDGHGARPFAPEGENPPRLRAGGLLLEITSLNDQHALRVRDPRHPRRTAFPGIDSFPLDPAWRIDAAWVALDEPRDMAIDTVAGIPTTVRLTHEARFTHEGREVRLLPTHWKSGKAMFVIRDRTAGHLTYPASRFLLAEPGAERITLDFNQAFNPPCAFTDLAICPLPPPQNVLPFEVRAGELKLDAH